jgi:hypothetical protein
MFSESTFCLLKLITLRLTDIIVSAMKSRVFNHNKNSDGAGATCWPAAKYVDDDHNKTQFKKQTLKLMCHKRFLNLVEFLVFLPEGVENISRKLIQLCLTLASHHTIQIN